MKRLSFLLLPVLFVLSGCATSPTAIPQDPFSLSHFAQLQPGVTTRTQAISLFGIPTNSMDMSGGMSMDMWIYGTRGVSIMYKNDRLDKLLSVINIYLPPYEKERLGLTSPPTEDRLTPKAMIYLHPGETTVEEAEQILGKPENALRSTVTILIWSHGVKMVSIAFKDGVMSRVISLSNIQLSQSELMRLNVVANKATQLK